MRLGSRVFAVMLGLVGTAALVPTAEASATLITATSQQHRALRFMVDAPAVSTATTSASLCSTPGGEVVEAKLWMPDMGHGSAPTQLARLDGQCTQIDHIDFIMSGDWEIRVRYADGDVATVAVSVQD
jgi:hypothetical protein